MEVITDHLREVAAGVDSPQVDAFVNELLTTKRVFVMGAGRSGLVARAFAMRLMHVGLIVYVVGEMVTPALKKGDLVVAVSGSGNTNSIADLGEVAKDKGTKLVTITNNPDSRLGNISDIVITLKPRKGSKPGDRGYEKTDGLDAEAKQLMPLGTLFEITSMVFLDGIIARIMAMRDLDEEQLRRRHTVLE
jgi:6-phospho-3-hexuloisomerase